MKIQMKLKGITDLKRISEISKVLKTIPEVETVEITMSSEYDRF